MTKKQRKSFEPLPSNENPQFLEDGKRIYFQLREKYPNSSVEHLDNILNALCCALICLTQINVDKDDRIYFLQLIHKILSQNIDL